MGGWRREKGNVPYIPSYYAEFYPTRDRAIAEAYRSGAYSMQQIGAYFAVGRMTVSRAVKQHGPSLQSEKQANVHGRPDPRACVM